METEEERRARLQNDAATKQLSLVMETEEERKARLTQLRLAQESEDQRSAKNGMDLRLEFLNKNSNIIVLGRHAMGTIFLVQLYSKEEIILRLGGRFYHLIIM